MCFLALRHDLVNSITTRTVFFFGFFIEVDSLICIVTYVACLYMLVLSCTSPSVTSRGATSLYMSKSWKNLIKRMKKIHQNPIFCWSVIGHESQRMNTWVLPHGSTTCGLLLSVSATQTKLSKRENLFSILLSQALITFVQVLLELINCICIIHDVCK